MTKNIFYIENNLEYYLKGDYFISINLSNMKLELKSTRLEETPFNYSFYFISSGDKENQEDIYKILKTAIITLPNSFKFSNLDSYIRSCYVEEEKQILVIGVDLHQKIKYRFEIIDEFFKDIIKDSEDLKKAKRIKYSIDDKFIGEDYQKFHIIGNTIYGNLFKGLEAYSKYEFNQPISLEQIEEVWKSHYPNLTIQEPYFYLFKNIINYNVFRIKLTEKSNEYFFKYELF